jgi:hypothetical protein
VVLASSGSFDCADHDDAVIRFAQDDEGLGWVRRTDRALRDCPPSRR